MDSIKIGQRNLGSSFPYIATILHFNPSQALVNVEETRSQVHTGAVQGPDYFLGIFRHGLYVRDSLEVWVLLRTNRRSRHEPSLSVNMRE